MKAGLKVLIFIVVVIFIIVAILTGARIWLNYVWFNKLGYVNVYTKILWARIGLWWTFFILFWIFAGLNIVFAFRKGNIQSLKIQQAGVPVEISKKVAVIISAIGLFILGLIMARNGSIRWEIILKLLNRTPFNLKDPAFGNDISFYVFTLPFYLFLKSWSLGTLILTIIAVGFLYLISGNVTFEMNKFTMSDGAKRHIIFLIMLIAIIIAWNYRLKGYQLLFSRRGVIFGAGYTDIMVVRYAYYVMIAFSIFTACLTYMGMRKASFKQPLIGYGVLIGAAIVITGIIPGVVQRISVLPTELVRELPYIKHNITFTRKGFNLDIIERESFPVNDSLDAEDFLSETGVAKHIRLWDHRPLKSTFSQIQEFRLYYDFYDVDVDRYRFSNDYRQVMLAGREINYTKIPQEARTWVNMKLQFTHGYGFVMTPVNEFSSEGLPIMIVKDIPPRMTVPLKLERPEIYYGELTTPYVIVNTKLPEFDYPMGDTNVTTKYQGTGGLPIKNSLRKLLFAIRLKDLEIIFTHYLTPESRVMIYRSIQERVPKIAPFLKYDPDPYLVVHDGRLFYILDAYTITDHFPYSNPYKDGYNYIRNAVKITVDAYNGDVTFYVIDREDPVVQTYARIFPALFRDISEMPEGLKQHIRYPIYIFGVQAELYSTYHMTDPQVFYNKEDKWNIPREIYGETETEMIPYYTIIMFPDQNGREEFVLILPFTPVNKHNMLAWIAAMCDPENYGRIVEYKFPKEKLIYGPFQIESRIDQHAEISQLFTLWGQRGSSIIRGNLLVIPIRDSLIYVEPVYLQAEKSALPEMKRVIVGYMDNVAIGLTLEDALYKIFGAKAPAVAVEKIAVRPEEALPAVPAVQNLIRRAQSVYSEAQLRLKEGDFAGYGERIRELESILHQLAEQVE